MSWVFVSTRDWMSVGLSSTDIQSEYPRPPLAPPRAEMANEAPLLPRRHV